MVANKLHELLCFNPVTIECVYVDVIANISEGTSTSVVLMECGCMKNALRIIQESRHKVKVAGNIWPDEKRVVKVRTVELVKEMSEVDEFSTKLLRRHCNFVLFTRPEVRLISFKEF